MRTHPQAVYEELDALSESAYRSVGVDVDSHAAVELHQHQPTALKSWDAYLESTLPPATAGKLDYGYGYDGSYYQPQPQPPSMHDTHVLPQWAFSLVVEAAAFLTILEATLLGLRTDSAPLGQSSSVASVDSALVIAPFTVSGVARSPRGTSARFALRVLSSGEQGRLVAELQDQGGDRFTFMSLYRHLCRDLVAGGLSITPMKPSPVSRREAPLVFAGTPFSLPTVDVQGLQNLLSAVNTLPACQYGTFSSPARNERGVGGWVGGWG